MYIYLSIYLSICLSIYMYVYVYAINPTVVAGSFDRCRVQGVGCRVWGGGSRV